MWLCVYASLRAYRNKARSFGENLDLQIGDAISLSMHLLSQNVHHCCILVALSALLGYC
jgi:hypothetical protein